MGQCFQFFELFTLFLKHAPQFQHCIKGVILKCIKNRSEFLQFRLQLAAARDDWLVDGSVRLRFLSRIRRRLL